MAEPPTFAEMAVETRISLDDISAATFAIWLECQAAVRIASGKEVLAARIGLNPDVTARILAGDYRHTEVLAAAHYFFREMIPHEAAFRALVNGSKNEVTHERPATEQLPVDRLDRPAGENPQATMGDDAGEQDCRGNGAWADPECGDWESPAARPLIAAQADPAGQGLRPGRQAEGAHQEAEAPWRTVVSHR